MNNIVNGIDSSFEYHLEDLPCEFCKHTLHKSKAHKHGCREENCRFNDIHNEAIKNGRIKRKRGHFKLKNFHSTQKEEHDYEQ
ncbi:MAG: hypothetical protein LBC71_06680 [Oscillospiraceae bacterium]|nr:hypothetical protein [Oscillospiraceae bacterium]